MGLGSSSLTMVELVRAYSTFATYGTLVEPYFIETVKDRDGTIIEQHTPTELQSKSWIQWLLVLQTGCWFKLPRVVRPQRPTL